MKLLHLSDLHLGKRVNEFSLLEDQRYILDQILSIADAEKPDGVLIAGDVYDKAVPSAEAVSLLDDFLAGLAQRRLPVFIISGNHDSPERVAFGGRVMADAGIHLSPVYDKALARITLTDAWGPVDICLLPFLKPAQVRRFYPDCTGDSSSEAVRTALRAAPPRAGCRCVLLAHQFVTGAVSCESESVTVGGSDSVDAAVFDGYDYVALGHLHRPQHVRRDTLRYCGSPLAYSFSECREDKSVTVAELQKPGEVHVRCVPLSPLRSMREARGPYRQLMSREFARALGADSYLHLTLTDESDIPNALANLRTVYPYLMRLDYDNLRTRAGAMPGALPDVEQKDPLALLDEFYQKQNGQPLSEAQRSFAADRIRRVWEEDV